MKILHIVTVLSLSGTAAVRANSELQTSAYRNSIAQDEVRRKTDEARRQLARMIEDLQQSGYEAPETALARQAAGNLDSLGAEQILPLIKSLKEAGTGADAGGARGVLAKASVEQKKIETTLKTMAGDISRSQDEASIQIQLENLLLRQLANRRQTGVLPKANPNKELESICAAEQNAIREDIRMTLATLRGVAAEGAAIFASARAELDRQQITTRAEAASADLAARNFPDGTAHQDHIIAAVEGTLARLKEETTAAERMRDAARKVEALARQQESLARAAEKAPDSARRDLQEAQFQLADKLAATQREIQDLNAAAAQDAREAGKSMTTAAQDFLRSDRNSIASQKEAAEHLANAAKQLEERANQLAAQQPNTDAARAAADLAGLSQKITDLQQEANAPASPGQKGADEMANRAAGLQQEALPQSTDAARSLGEAAAQLQQGDTKSASQALAAANAAVQSQMQAAAQAAARQQKMQQLNGQIAEAQARAGQARSELQKAQPGQNLMPAVNETENAEKALQAAAQAAGQPGMPGAAGQAIREAQQALQNSRQAAAQMQANAALGSNAEARQALNRATQAVRQAMASALAQGSPSSPSPDPLPGQTGGSGAGQEAQDLPGFLPGMGGAATAMGTARNLRQQDREALAALRKENAPTEYRGMAEQYLKNLAAGDLPGDPLP